MILIWIISNTILFVTIHKFKPIYKPIKTYQKWIKIYKIALSTL